LPDDSLVASQPLDRVAVSTGRVRLSHLADAAMNSWTRWRRRSTIAAVTILAAATLGACGTNSSSDDAEGPAAIVYTTDDGFAGTLVEDPPLQLAEVVLSDTEHEPYRLGGAAADRVTAVFFGLTNCDDVCPTAMADLAAAKRALPAASAEKVDVVFITVDPKRDTAPVLRSWLDRFDKTFVGLRGSMGSAHRAEDSLYATRSDNESSGGDHHEGGDSEASDDEVHGGVSHSGSIYVFRPTDRSVLYSGGTTVAGYAKDFARLRKTS
jgi:protein SCO1/2